MWTAFEGTTIDCLATSHRRLGLAGPPVAERERDGHDLLPNQFEAAWEAFLEAVEPDVGEAVRRARDRAASRLPPRSTRRGTTLIHGDVRDEQLGFAPDGRVVLLDWGLATRGQPRRSISRGT